MILDLLLLCWLIFASLTGVRDGIVRKLVSSAMTIVAVILGQIFMRDAANVLVEGAGVDPSGAPLLGFLAVFFGILLAQALIYRFATGSYKIGGIPDRIGGGVLGVFQGVLFLSSFLLIMAMAGWPSKSMTRDSRIYRGIVNISPQIIDAITTAGPDAVEELKGISTPNMRTPQAQKKPDAPRFPTSASIRKADSLRTSLRR